MTHHFYTNLETVNHFTCFPEDKKTDKETYGAGPSPQRLIKMDINITNHEYITSKGEYY